MSNAFTADRERNWHVRTSHKRTFTGALKACVAWINRNRRPKELVTISSMNGGKSNKSLYPPTDTARQGEEKK